MRILLYTGCLFLLLLPATATLAQGTQQTFGKNRVQYHNFFEQWYEYESENFITYWYGLSRNVAQSTVQLAEYDFNEIQSILEHRINQKVQIIVYTDLSDLKQSNIGTEEIFTNTGGQTKIVGTTIFVYFNGDHTHLRKQIREGVAQVYLNAMLFGANIQEIVQNAVMLNLPNWFKDGLISYVGEPWNTELDNKLRQYINSEDYKGFSRFVEDDPELAGQSLWFYIADQYGRPTVSNLLYLTRINRSIESGFLYVLGNSFETVIQEWELYYKQRYQLDLRNRTATDGELLPVKNRKKRHINTIKVSPDGSKLLYTLNQEGRYKVYMYDLMANKKKVIFKGGLRNPFQDADYNYPLLAWNPNGLNVGIIYEKRDKLKLLDYDVYTDKSEEVPMPEQYQRLYSMDYMDPYNILLSGAVDGLSDIFVMQTRTRQTTRITTDYHDDRDAVFTQAFGQRGILFASNRPDTLLETRKLDTILPINTFDIFYYNLDADYNELVRVTNTPMANERQPMAIDSTWFSYLSDRRGIYNREMGQLEDFIHHYEKKITLLDDTEIVMHIDSTLDELPDSVIARIDTFPIIRQRALTHISTNYDRNIVFQDYASLTGKTAEAVAFEDEIKMRLVPTNTDTTFRPRLTYFQSTRVQLIDELEEAFTETGDTTKAEEIEEIIVEQDPMDNFFQSEFGNPPKIYRLEEQKEESLLEEVSILPSLSSFNLGNDLTNRQVHKFRPSQITPYRLQFRTDIVTTQLDNSLLFEGLNSFAANPDGLQTPEPGILLKANVKDLFEDYEFEGGIRIPTTFDGAEYFVTFENKKKRLDHIYSFYMRRQRENLESQSIVPQRQEAKIIMGQYGVRYPLDLFRSLRATATIRQDRLLQLATDQNSFNTPTDKTQRVGLRLEYVFDNSQELSLNLRRGTRYKVYSEVLKKFSINEPNAEGFNFSQGYMGILGVDARHYQPLLKHSIWATRLAASTSFGDEQILYFLGGVDNWLLPENNDDIPIPAGNFAFQTLAANLRGFDRGIRNGNSYALINTELRVPMFRYFSRRLQSSFLRNFQVIGFADVGTAWVGNDPYRDDNPLNTSFFQEGETIDVTVNYFREPVVFGYGVGARAVLFGYFLRVDYAWGVETQLVQEPKLYLSLGLDF